MATGSRDRILEVALDQFYRRGYLATSVDDIIEAAGVSKSNFYYHFKSKEDLALEVVGMRRSQLEERVGAILVAGPPSPRARLESFLTHIADAHSSTGCPFGNLVAEMSEHSEKLRCQLSDMFGDLTTIIEMVVANGQKAGELRADVAAGDAAALIVHTIQGAQLVAKCHRCSDTFHQGVRALLTLLSEPTPAARL